MQNLEMYLYKNVFAKNDTDET